MRRSVSFLYAQFYFVVSLDFFGSMLLYESSGCICYLFARKKQKFVIVVDIAFLDRRREQEDKEKGKPAIFR